MAASEHHVRLAAKLYQCRTACKSLLGARYPEVIEQYANIVRAVATARKIEALVAATQVADELKAVSEKPIIRLCLMAAAVEILEPTH